MVDLILHFPMLNGVRDECAMLNRNGSKSNPDLTFGELNSCELGVFRFEFFLLLLLRLLLNKNSYIKKIQIRPATVSP